MSGVSQVIFIAKHLSRTDIEGRDVIDVGSYNYNGSAKPLIEWWRPNSYLGIDVTDGPGVDRVLDADRLVDTFGTDCFDVVMSMEMLEHSPQWWISVQNMKQICRPKGIVVLSTRSFGYPCHGFPNDYWRFEVEDMRVIFNDFEILALEADPFAAGVLILARKPNQYVARDERVNVSPYSVVVGRRVAEIPKEYRRDPYFKRLALKQRTKDIAGRAFIGLGRVVSKLLRLH